MPTTTKYVELVRDDNLASFPTPLHSVVDKIIDTADSKEVRVWVHVFVKNYAHTPVTAAAKIDVRFLHTFGSQLGGGGQFDYSQATILWNHMTSYINGYVVAPIIGDKLRILCTANNLPPGPYQVFVTYYLL